MAKKQYENFTVFGARIYGMRNLWEPSREYLGRPTERPSYIAGFIVPKTRGHWSEEPVFAAVWGAMQKIYGATMNGLPYNNVDWPIRDGDMPAPGKPQADWARGHWMFGGNSGDAIKVEIVQNGVPVPLVNRAIVKPGDYVTVAGATAQKSNAANGIKFYINTVLFMAPGEEIAVGNSVSGAELMAAAQAQGLHVAGFSNAPAGFGGQPAVHPHGPQQGAGQPFAAPGGFGAPQPGFTPGAPPNGPQPGFAPPNMAPGAYPGVPGHGGMQNGAPGNATFPSNPGFAPPGTPQGPFAGQPFAAPQFPQR